MVTISGLYKTSNDEARDFLSQTWPEFVIQSSIGNDGATCRLGIAITRATAISPLSIPSVRT